MGNLIARFWASFAKAEKRILMLGLDAAGKTTILYKFKLGDVVATIPTIGFNVETLEYKNLRFTMWDVGGQDKIRKLWRHYYDGANAIIFVVDCNDRERIDFVRTEHDQPFSAREELANMLAEDELRECPVLVFANKQDLPNAMTVNEVAERLGLTTMRRREWHVEGTCAVTSEGLYEGLNWLADTLKKQKS